MPDNFLALLTPAQKKRYEAMPAAQQKHVRQAVEGSMGMGRTFTDAIGQGLTFNFLDDAASAIGAAGRAALGRGSFRENFQRLDARAAALRDAQRRANPGTQMAGELAGALFGAGGVFIGAQAAARAAPQAVRSLAGTVSRLVGLPQGSIRAGLATASAAGAADMAARRAGNNPVGAKGQHVTEDALIGAAAGPALLGATKAAQVGTHAIGGRIGQQVNAALKEAGIDTSRLADRFRQFVTSQGREPQGIAELLEPGEAANVAAIISRSREGSRQLNRSAERGLDAAQDIPTARVPELEAPVNRAAIAAEAEQAVPGAAETFVPPRSDVDPALARGVAEPPPASSVPPRIETTGQPPEVDLRPPAGQLVPDTPAGSGPTAAGQRPRGPDTIRQQTKEQADVAFDAIRGDEVPMDAATRAFFERDILPQVPMNSRARREVQDMLDSGNVTVGVMERMRRVLGAQERSGSNPFNAQTAKAVRENLDAILFEGSPDARAAVGAFRTGQEAREGAELGQRILSDNISTDAVTAALREMPQATRQGMPEGLAAGLQDVLNSGQKSADSFASKLTDSAKMRENVGRALNRDSRLTPDQIADEISLLPGGKDIANSLRSALQRTRQSAGESFGKQALVDTNPQTFARDFAKLEGESQRAAGERLLSDIQTAMSGDQTSRQALARRVVDDAGLRRRMATVFGTKDDTVSLLRAVSETNPRLSAALTNAVARTERDRGAALADSAFQSGRAVQRLRGEMNGLTRGARDEAQKQTLENMATRLTEGATKADAFVKELQESVGLRNRLAATLGLPRRTGNKSFQAFVNDVGRLKGQRAKQLAGEMLKRSTEIETAAGFSGASGVLGRRSDDVRRMWQGAAPNTRRGITARTMEETRATLRGDSAEAFATGLRDSREARDRVLAGLGKDSGGSLLDVTMALREQSPEVADSVLKQIGTSERLSGFDAAARALGGNNALGTTTKETADSLRALSTRFEKTPTVDGKASVREGMKQGAIARLSDSFLGQPAESFKMAAAVARDPHVKESLRYAMGDSAKADKIIQNAEVTVNTVASLTSLVRGLSRERPTDVGRALESMIDAVAAAGLGSSTAFKANIANSLSRKFSRANEKVGIGLVNRLFDPGFAKRVANDPSLIDSMGSSTDVFRAFFVALVQGVEGTRDASLVHSPRRQRENRERAGLESVE